MRPLRRFHPRRSAFLIGAIAPDIPLFLLFFTSTFYFTQVLNWDRSRTFHHLFDDLYFHDPGWIAAHNMLHSPTSLALGFLCIAILYHAFGRKLYWLFWFLVSCSIHSLIDIFTHYDDGPLIFFPFDWEARFQSPISYWDSNHFGREFSLFELVLCCMLLTYLLGWGVIAIKKASRMKQRAAEDAADAPLDVAPAGNEAAN